MKLQLRDQIEVGGVEKSNFSVLKTVEGIVYEVGAIVLTLREDGNGGFNISVEGSPHDPTVFGLLTPFESTYSDADE